MTRSSSPSCVPTALPILLARIPTSTGCRASPATPRPEQHALHSTRQLFGGQLLAPGARFLRLVSRLVEADEAFAGLGQPGLEIADDKSLALLHPFVPLHKEALSPGVLMLTHQCAPDHTHGVEAVPAIRRLPLPIGQGFSGHRLRLWIP